LNSKSSMAQPGNLYSFKIHEISPEICANQHFSDSVRGAQWAHNQCLQMGPKAGLKKHFDYGGTRV
jgi:hypothetical protein